MKWIQEKVESEIITREVNSTFRKAKIRKIGADIGLKIPPSLFKDVHSESEYASIDPIVDKLPVACIIYDPEYRLIQINPVAQEMLGIKTVEVFQKSAFGTVIPDSMREYFSELMGVISHWNMASNGRSTILRRKGDQLLCNWNALPIYDDLGNFEGAAFVYEEMNESLVYNLILEEQKKILEMIATGGDLSVILKTITGYMEQMTDRLMGSVLLINEDGKTLHTGAGESLPTQYNNLINGMEIADHNGSCGTALYRRQIVITSDTSTDPNWDKYKDIAIYFSLFSCTSIPIIGSKNQLLGTFAVYYRTQTIPTPSELQLAEIFSNIAGIAIEKNNTERKIRENEAFFKVITDNINDYIIICDLQQNIVFASASVKSGLGLSNPELIGMNIVDLIYSEDIPFVKKCFSHIYDEQLLSCKFRAVHYPEKDLRWIDGWAKLVKKQDGEIILIVGHDITEQKQIEEELNRNENQLNESQKLTQSGSFEWHIKDDKVYWSPNLYRLFGFSPNEIDPTFKWLQGYIHPADYGWVCEAIKMAIREKNQMTLGFRFFDKNKNILFIESSFRIIRDENSTAVKIIGIAQDITSRKKTEDALKLSEEKFRTAFEFANIGIALADLQGNFIHSNSSFCQILGYSEEEFNILRIENIVTPAMTSEFHVLLDRMIAGEINARVMECQFRHKLNYLLWGNLSIALLRDEYNKPQYFNIVLQDITEKKNAEENQKILTKDLIEQNKYLQQVSYITSHNLRSPIANILGLVELFNMELREDEKRDIVDNLKTAAINLDNVVYDLSKIIDIKKGISEHKQEINFEDLFNLIKESFKNLISSSKITIITQFSKAPVIYSVLSYVLSIVSNLFENAVKYKSPKRPLIVKLTTNATDDYICLSICDNGLGFNMERDSKKIFGMYKRFHTHVQGKGMGLHLVKTQIESLGGRIEVMSQLDKGTCFTVFFRK